MSIWENQKGEDGRSSLTENIIPKVVKIYCKDKEHFFEVIDRDAICKKCGMGAKFIPGLHRLDNGQILRVN